MNTGIDISESLRFRYITANTPTYLFRYFVADPLVRELSDKRSEPELDELLKRAISSAYSIDDSVRAYVLAVAIALKGEGRNSYPLPWWDQIVQLARARRRSFSISSAEFNISPASMDLGSALLSSDLESAPGTKIGLGKWNISLTRG